MLVKVLTLQFMPVTPSRFTTTSDHYPAKNGCSYTMIAIGSKPMKVTALKGD
jgi:hypothetical protein